MFGDKTNTTMAKSEINTSSVISKKNGENIRIRFLTEEEISAEVAFEKAKKTFEEIKSKRKIEITKLVKDYVKTYNLDIKSMFPIFFDKKETKMAEKVYFDPVSKTSWSGKGRAKAPFQSIRKNPEALKKYLIVNEPVKI